MHGDAFTTLHLVSARQVAKVIHNAIALTKNSWPLCASWKTIWELFSDDEDVQALLSGAEEGMTGVEIQRNTIHRHFRSG